MTLLAIDPGPQQSAVVEWDGKSAGFAQILPNVDLLESLRFWDRRRVLVAIEMIASMGMPVGKEVFETCLLIGRVQEIVSQAGIPIHLVYRHEVKMHLCGSMRAKDANIRQALIDKFGPPGTTKNPGTLHGIKSHLWSALAVAVYVSETTDKVR